MKLLFALFLLLFAGAASAEPISAGLIALGTAAGAGAGAALMTGLMVAGTAISVVGTVTGSKKLSRFGALVSLAGGIGAGYQALTAAGTQVAESSAATAALSQTPVAGEAAVATGVSGSDVVARGLEEAAPGLVNQAAGAAAPAAVEAAAPAITNPLDARLAAGTAATPASLSPVADALATASKHVGSFLKENKELVKLGAGAIDGAMRGRAASDLQAADWAREDQRRADYNAGIQSGSNVPFRVQPGVNVTQTPVQDPNRYIPQRGLINQNTGG